tara:strand:+ start:2735 stop:2953 length:219 start_codon:yes stop_codon:yes gene_type:complete
MNTNENREIIATIRSEAVITRTDTAFWFLVTLMVLVENWFFSWVFGVLAIAAYIASRKAVEYLDNLLEGKTE